MKPSPAEQAAFEEWLDATSPSGDVDAVQDQWEAYRDENLPLIGEPEPTPTTLWDLAREYHRRTEEYDRTVCTGPLRDGGALPATHHELGLSNVNARKVRQEIQQRTGVDPLALARAIRQYGQSRECEHDMAALPDPMTNRPRI